MIRYGNLLKFAEVDHYFLYKNIKKQIYQAGLADYTEIPG